MGWLAVLDLRLGDGRLRPVRQIDSAARLSRVAGCGHSAGPEPGGRQAPRAETGRSAGPSVPPPPLISGQKEFDAIYVILHGVLGEAGRLR